MRYLVFGPEKATYPVALLARILRKQDLMEHVKGIEPSTVVYSIDTPQKASNTKIKEYLAELLPTLCTLQTEYILCTDGAVFKVLTGAPRVDRAGGYVLPCKLADYTHFNVIYMPSPQQTIYDPSLLAKVSQGLSALVAHKQGMYMPPGVDIIHTAHYPSELHEIRDWLIKLVDTDLTCDIEAFSLRHYDAGIGTISFAWNKHEGIAFTVDLGTPAHARAVRDMLRQFFQERARRNNTRTIYHNASYDVYVLVYQLFMQHVLDTAGMLKGIETMLVGVEDSQLVTYLATNSCAGNQLGLKAQAQEFAGNYMVDVTDIRKVPVQNLLTYNLVDSLATWYVFDKHWSTMVADQQLDIYENLFKPCLADIIQMQLTGMPLDMAEVKRGKAIMEHDRDTAVNALKLTPEVIELERRLTDSYVEKKNAEYKKKRITAADVAHLDECKINLNSPAKLQRLLYEVMGLPVITWTDSKQPGTDGDTLKALINHATTQAHKDLLQHLADFKVVDKILGTFVAAFERAYLAPDGHYYLFGFYNLGGTLSGRLSSNEPNMQNLPAGGADPKSLKGRLGKMIKKMFKAPRGWLFIGLDFNSLEDMISALTTKDPNKLKVYTDGYDGHCLRAYSYFTEQMPDIDPNSVTSINSIEVKYKPLRQDSKAPTFALTYQGTWRTLMTNCGFSEEKSKMIEGRYREMYSVSIQWVQTRLDQAAKDGYVTVAFGLRLRTPMLRQCIMGTKKTPYEAVAEGRTAGNAMGQSYGLLNSRAYMAFMQKVRASPYRHDIRLSAQIHDAGYLMVRDDINVLAWVNEHLVKEAKWQQLPEIQHPQVKLGGALSIFHPTWADEISIPNGATADQILSIAHEHIKQ